MNARVSTRAFVFQRLVHATLAALMLGVGLAACDGHERQRRPSAERVTRDTAQAGGDVADSTTRNPDAAWITDGNALALLAVLNARQIAAANVELDAWHTDTIRSFAAAVAREHAELQHSADSLSARLHVVPVVSALDQQIDSAFRSRVDSLRGLRGAPLERAFAHEQVVAEQAIAEYADQLTGAVQAPEIRALMESAATDARSRLSRAQAFELTLVLADSIKNAAVADSIAQAAERAAARAAARVGRRHSSAPVP
jgi:hypothetical protein